MTCRSSSNRFPMNSGSWKLTSVMFPPRLRQAGDEPLANRVGSDRKDDGDRPDGVLCRPDRWPADGQDAIHLAADELYASSGSRSNLPSAKRYSRTILWPST